MTLADVVSLQKQGRIDEAISICQRLHQVQPQNVEVIHLLGLLLMQRGQTNEAVRYFRKSVELDPNNPQFYNNLGAALGATGLTGEAVECGRKALNLNPDSPDANHNLAVTLERAGQHEEATRLYRRVIELRPGVAERYTHLGSALLKIGRFQDSAKALGKSVKLSESSAAYERLAATCGAMGAQADAVRCLRHAVRLAPHESVLHSNLLLSMLHHADTTPEEMLRESREWDRRHAAPLRKEIRPHTQTKDPGRRLRIGYVSADFHEHPVARFIEPLLANHNQRHFDVFFYSNVRRKDAITTRFRQFPGVWRDIVQMADAAVADLIRHDSIDILVDLGGHTARNRLLVFARQPAPLQISYLGYPATSGLGAIQYRLTDSFADPPDTDLLHTERLIRLPKHAWCYEPSANLAVGPLPAIANGFVTFAALHRIQKIPDRVLHWWSQILKELPTAKLILSRRRFNTGGDETELRRCAENGIEPGRVQLIERASHESYLTAYHQIDIALDGFPYHGTATTCDALWMGVPTVTLAGHAHVSRTGVSLLTASGLDNCIASSPAQYVQKAIALASDIEKLACLRSNLREQMRPALVDCASDWCRSVEITLRDLWKEFCAQ